MIPATTTNSIATSTSTTTYTDDVTDDTLLEEYCVDFAEWPERWQLTSDDHHYGRQVLTTLKPFMLFLVHSGIQGDTLQRHFNNLWLLGLEIVRTSHINPALRRQAAKQLIADSVDDEGGPICRELQNDTARDAFDTTCRMLHQYLNAH